MEKKKILIVDDEEGLCRLIKLNLEETSQYEVKTETQATAALAVAQAFKPDLIPLDVLMPGMNGPKVARAIQADKSVQQIPIVFLTAAMLKEMKTDALGGGVTGFPLIEKPVGLTALIDSIEQHIGRSQA